MKTKILLVKPPFFSPLTPPLGIALLKAFLESHGYKVHCYDFNVDPELWVTHHKYFSTLQKLETVTINDGYSKLWYILNAHSLAYMNGATPDACAQVLRAVMPLYGIEADESIIQELLIIVDRFFQRLQKLTDEFDVSDFSVVGTSTYTTSLASSLFFLRQVKQKAPTLKTIMGGGVFADDLALGSDNLDTLLREYPFVDHVVLGEGELLTLKLINGEFSDKRVISIAEIEGKTLPMQEVPVPDFSDFNMDNYLHLSIEGARSCPFECSFCSETIQWGLYRKKPKTQLPDQVIRMANQYNNNTYFMGDSLMNPYIMTLSSGLLEQGGPILYDGYLRADKIATNRERVKMWSRSGMFRARLGIESASDDILKMMVKMTTPQTISEVLKSLSNAGIRTTTYWIVGFPGETEQHFQETLDFIKEHHRYIYELEAHPYYYYPYGQIGSRLYECESLYPDHVTEVIKFQLWDVLDVKPERMERYDRLRRISKLASELGLPNIYTMAERYAAEDRWHRLHPLSTEVYEGTGIHRGLPQPLKEPLKIWDEQERFAAGGDDSVLSYHVLINKKVNEAVLTDSVRKLVDYNEMLQVSVDQERYVNDVREGESFLSVFSVNEEAEKDTAAVIAEVRQTYAQQVKPLFGQSVHVVLVEIEGKTDINHLVLLGHRAVVDSQSIQLLLEDLFRIYEQLDNDRAISLYPVETPYSDFLQKVLLENGHGHQGSKDNGRLGDSGNGNRQTKLEASAAGSNELVIEASLYKRMSLIPAQNDNNMPLSVVISRALLQRMQKIGGEEAASLDVYKNDRLAKAKLERTVGPLMVTTHLPLEIVKEDNLMLGLDDIHQALHLASANMAAAKTAAPVLLNLEYLIAEPWLGGDNWVPQSFILAGQQPRAPYHLEVVPILSKRHIRVQLRYLDTPEMQRLVNDLNDHLIEEIEMILDYCEKQTAVEDADEEILVALAGDEFNF